MIRIENLSKSFTLHNQGGAVIPVMAGAALTVQPRRMRRPDRPVRRGQIHADADGLGQLPGRRRAASWSATPTSPPPNPRQIIALRRETLGYVSQFLRVVPRVPTLDVVAEPLLALGTPADRGPRPRGQAFCRG